jgi:hypothetical protein
MPCRPGNTNRRAPRCVLLAIFEFYVLRISASKRDVAIAGIRVLDDSDGDASFWITTSSQSTTLLYGQNSLSRFSSALVFVKPFPINARYAA